MSPDDSHRQEDRGDGFLLVLAISLLIHALFFAGLLFMPDFENRGNELPPTITVDLVSLSLPSVESVGQTESQEPDSVKIPEKKNNRKDKVIIDKKKSVKKKLKKITKKKNSRKIKKKTIRRRVKNSSKVIDSAMERLKDKVDQEEKTQPERDISEALSRLRKKVDTGEGKKELSRGSSSDPLKKRLEGLRSEAAIRGVVSLPGQGSSGGGVATIEQVYRSNVGVEVQNAWAFPDHLAGEAIGLVTEISFDVLPGGELADIRVTLRSGDKYLDESAVNAVKKASPFAPHLRGINKSRVRVLVRFAPKARN